MEVAGLVLGAYPVVILVFEQFKTGAEYFSNWRRFRRQYEGFIRNIEAQQLFLEGTLQDLLCGGLDPYISRHNSKETFMRIVTDPAYSGWTDPLLIENLKARLGKRYDWYMSTIRRIYDIFQELQDVIDIEALQSSDRTPDWWRYQWERIKKTLFEERYDQHREATRLISELKQMLVLSDAQPHEGNRSLSSIVPFLNKVRTNAYSLHDALKSAWHCRCSSAHRAMLQLEKRDHDREADFNLFFVLRNSEKQVLENHKEDAEPQCTYSYIEREACIKILDHENMSKQKENIAKNTVVTITSPHSTATPPPSNSLPDSNTPEVMLSPPVRPITRSKKSRESVSSSASFKTSSISFFHGLRDKWSIKMRSSRSDIPTTLITAEETQLVSFGEVPPPDPNVKSTKSSKRTANKSVKHLQNQSGNPASSNPQKLAAVAGNSSNNVVQAITEAPPFAATEERLNRDGSNKSKENELKKRTILDLCSTLAKSTGSSHLDYVLEIQKRHFHFFFGPTAVREKECSVALQELLEGQSHRFPPMKRVQVATILASSLLQLQHTQWIDDKWSKNDIFFRTRDGQVMFEKLYLAKEFPSRGQVVTTVLAPPENSSSMNSDQQSTSTAISKLTPISTSTLSTLPPIKSYQLKTSLECLGIILIELCLGEPIERHSNKVHVRPSSSSITSPSTQPNHDFCLAIANAWTWEEINAYEPSFSDPIDMCLRFPGLGRVGQGRLDEVLGDVYAAVVRPLQDGLERRSCF